MRKRLGLVFVAVSGGVIVIRFGARLTASVPEGSLLLSLPLIAAAFVFLAMGAWLLWPTITGEGESQSH